MPIVEIGPMADATISDGEHDDKTCEYEPFYGRRADAVFEIAEDEEAAGGELDQRVHRRNREPARAALAAQPEPAEDGNVVVGLYGRFATWAARTRRHDGQTLWNPRNADVQKAAKN